MIRTAIAAVASTMILASFALAGPPVGWRTDGTGQYPSADPPTKWSDSENVVWKTPMPNWSNATPCIVGDRIFVNAEPTTLICVSKADGSILWQKTNSYEDVMTETDRQQAAADKAKADEIRKSELAPLTRERNELGKQMQPLARNKTPSDDEKKQLADLRAKANDVQKKISAVEDRLVTLGKWEMPPTEGTNGHSTFTPVSDGKVVVAMYNNGVVACYDMDGNRKWIIKIDERCPNNWGASSSPVIVGDKVVVQIKTMIALNLSDGKEAWKCEGATWKWGTPFVTRIGQAEVLITAGGHVVRGSDGKLLGGSFGNATYNSPIVRDSIAYLVDERGAVAARLSPGEGPDKVEIKNVWKSSPKKDRYYASPVLVDGLLYAITKGKHLVVMNVDDGAILAEKQLDIAKMEAYPSITSAGKYVFVSNEDGTTVVYEPGKELKEVNRNSLERFRACPVFDGSRVYIRGYKHLYCIGR